MRTGTVTCVVPTHRRDVALRRALDSIADQTQRVEAIIVVDDVASQDTRALVTTHPAHSRIVYVDNSTTERPGASSSRNAGARLARSDYLAFLDDDDRWHPEFLEKCIARMEATGVCLATAWGIVEVGEEFVSRPWLAANELTAQDCLAWNPGLTGSSFVVRRSSFEAIGGFDDGLPVFNDLDFFVRFLHSGFRYGVVAEELFIQTADGDDHLSSRSARRARGIQKYMAKHSAGLTPGQTRTLNREVHLAQRYAGQRPHLSAYHFLLMWLNSNPSQFMSVVRNKLARRKRMYV